jgi:hypothetical protein
VDGFCQSTIFTVGVDGSDLRRLVPPEVPALVPRWSPDGSTIVFHTATPRDTTTDISTVRPDGTGLQALTNDGASVFPFWTREGRIVFIRWTVPFDGSGELWLMDADGGSATRLEATIPALTAAGCMVCPYPDDQGRLESGNGLNLRWWQPLSASEP